MKKRVLSIVLLFLSINLFAIGFGFQVLDVKTSPDFANNKFPLSIVYQFNFPVPDFYPGNTTLFTFRLDNGLSERTLYQNPEDGRFIDSDVALQSQFINPDARNYTAQYDEFLLIFEQGLFGQNLFKLHFSFGGRFEMAFERWAWMFDKANTEGLFWKSPSNARYDLDYWYGVPELSGERNVFQTMLNFGLSFNLLRGDNTVINGIKIDAMYRYSPASVQLFERSNPSADFSALTVDLDLVATPVAVYQKNNTRTLFSIMIGNKTQYKFIQGNRVPAYIQGNKIYGSYVPNTEHVIVNDTYLTVFGPQMGAKDLYPYIKIFHSAGIALGSALNTLTVEEIAEFSGSVGFRAELNIYNICRLFYQVGYLYSAPFNGQTGTIKASFGFSMEV